MSQRDLEAVTGVTHNAICRIERGVADPYPGTIRNLTGALRTDEIDVVLGAPALRYKYFGVLPSPLGGETTPLVEEF